MYMVVQVVKCKDKIKKCHVTGSLFKAFLDLSFFALSETEIGKIKEIKFWLLFTAFSPTYNGIPLV